MPDKRRLNLSTMEGEGFGGGELIRQDMKTP